MPRPCVCDRCAKPGPKRPGDCHRCWLYHNRADYRRLWDEGKTTAGHAGITVAGAAFPAQPPSRRPLPCVHLGRIIRRAGCGTCRRDDVRHCEAGHGEVSQNGFCDAVNPDGSFVCGDYEADRIPNA